jgi:hypothetical protein
MIEMGIDPDIILGKVQRQMGNLNIDDQGASSSKMNEEKRSTKSKSGHWWRIFQGNYTGCENRPYCSPRD